MTKPRVPISRLRKLWSYDPDTGEFIWLPRDRTDFGSAGAFVFFQRHHQGERAFKGKNNRGYLTTIISFDGVRTNVAAHIVAFCLHYGRYPETLLDHINGVRHDNRISNLREATIEQNSWNSRRTGLVGAYKHRNRWCAKVRYGGRGGPIKYIGSYATAEEAHAAYVEFCNQTRGEYSPYRSTP